MSTKNVRENLVDHLAINDLMARYVDAVNRRDWKAIEDQFCKEDGTWDVGGPSMGDFSFFFVGARNVAEGIERTINTTDFCFQTNHAMVIEVSGDRATARCAVNEVARPLGGESGVNLLGMYFDDIVREQDGEWRFKKRSFRFSYIDSTKLPGQLIATVLSME